MLSPGESFLILATGFTIILIANYIYLYIYKQDRDKDRLLTQTMGTIFIVFGTLKLFDLPKFAEIFKRYDIISKNIEIYPYLYPFIEIMLGIMYLKNYQIQQVNTATVALMITSIISVFISLNTGQKLRCGCLGSFLHIPLSYVTLTENFAMLGMVWSHNTRDRSAKE